jgi:hypothetical protein
LLPKFVREIEKNNKVIYSLGRHLRKFQIDRENKDIMKRAKARSLGLLDERYLGIKERKNSHYGERCFIVATGPSLRIDDLEKLNNEYTFGMNSICLAYEKTKWRPTYYGIQDDQVFAKLEGVLKERTNDLIFVGDNIDKHYSVPKEWVRFPLNTAYMQYDLRYTGKYFTEFSDDCYAVVYDGYTITYSLIQIAVYFGFKEIYLLGADCNYEEGKRQHFIEHGVVDPTFNTAHERMMVGYKKAKEYTDKHDIKIYNATRGGMLEIFPRVDLDEVLGIKEKT